MIRHFQLIIVAAVVGINACSQADLNTSRLAKSDPASLGGDGTGTGSGEGGESGGGTTENEGGGTSGDFLASDYGPSPIQNPIEFSTELTWKTVVDWPIATIQNDTVSPDGSLSADRITDNSIDHCKSIFQVLHKEDFNPSNSNDIVFSVFFKKNTGRFMKVFVWEINGANPHPKTTAVVDTLDPLDPLMKVDGGGRHDVQVIEVNDGWYRIAVLHERTAANESGFIKVGVYPACGDNVDQSPILSDTGSQWAWGAMIEEL